MIFLGSWLRDAARRLRNAGRDAPRLTADVLAAQVLGLDRPALFVQSGRELVPAERLRLEALLDRRLSGEPLAYILQSKEFYGRDFLVSPATLIPRPETEHLVQTALDMCPESRLRFADLGTGSGCVAVTLAAERTGWTGAAVDISRPALDVARANARTHAVDDRLAFVLADMNRPLFRPASLDLIVSNPPYVSRPEYDCLAAEVLREPQQALVPVTLNPDSPSGMESLERIIQQAAGALVPGGRLCLEHGWEQAEAVRLCLSCNIWDIINTYQDIAGNNRGTSAVRTTAVV